jgi:hypothetical protein
MEIEFPLKEKYRQPGRTLRRTGVDPPQGTKVFTIGLSSKRSRQGGHSGGVGRAGRRGLRWPPGIKQRRRAI